MNAPVRYELASTIGFWQSVQKLSNTQRKHLLGTLDKVHQGQKSVRVHKLEGVPFVSFGVNKDALRVICRRDGELLLMCHAGAHDPAYDWARRHKVLQVGRHVRILRSRLESAPPPSPADAPPAPSPVAAPEPAPPAGPLHTLDDDLFATFDVGPHAAAVLRTVPDDDALLELLEHFPVARADALMALALDPEDRSAIETAYLQALDAAERGEPAAPPSFRDAVADAINAGTIWKPGADDDLYRQALEGDFAAWRVFLHPSQRRVVRAKAAKGTVKVTGGPGTGKTIVALHRAALLAERHAPGRVLLTTFNATLARQLAVQLDQLVGAESALRERVDVRSLTAVAQGVLRDAGRPDALVTDDEECWETALTHDAAARGRRFYEGEREHVVARSGAWTDTAYARVRRSGRSARLDRRARREVWKVLDAYEAALAARGGGDRVALAREATRALLEGQATSPWVAVVCDEVQDVGASELRLLAALARDPATGRPRPDGLTLCGDGHQRIYRVPVPLQECGIHVRGRASRRLRLNYRTTEAIRRHAVAVVRDLPLDDLDEGTGDPLRGYRSLRAGQPPEEHVFDSASAEADWIAARARDDAEPPLLVLARKTAYLEALKALLEARALQPRLLGSTDVPRPDDALLLCTLHRAKGLEAPRVIIAGRHLVPARDPGHPDPADKALWKRKERSLLYVGLTRARDWCATTRVTA